jgi:hypothetical protein
VHRSLDSFAEFESWKIIAFVRFDASDVDAHWISLLWSAELSSLGPLLNLLQIVTSQLVAHGTSLAVIPLGLIILAKPVSPARVTRRAGIAPAHPK